MEKDNHGIWHYPVKAFAALAALTGGLITFIGGIVYVPLCGLVRAGRTWKTHMDHVAYELDQEQGKKDWPGKHSRRSITAGIIIVSGTALALYGTCRSSSTEKTETAPETGKPAASIRPCADSTGRSCTGQPAMQGRPAPVPARTAPTVTPAARIPRP
ncbi:MAG: hypothetical protein M3O22_03470 [Pseudomonadota bacterium]|nr:hypothetical protein [Pseudomonadota bacterium]